MIAVRLFGGLGNQMFQYAAARRLAYRHNTALLIDSFPLDQDGYRTYGLSCFNISENFITPFNIFNFSAFEGFRRVCVAVLKKGFPAESAHIFMYKYSPIRGLCQRYHEYEADNTKFPDLMCGHFLSQRFYHFDSDVLGAPDNMYMMGSWQSEKYFREIEETIRDDFSFKLPQTGINKKYADMIINSESVSLHIRRGDYVSDPSNREIYGTCDYDYYLRCLEYVATRINMPHIFIFSDDTSWVKDYFSCPFPFTIVDCNSEAAAFEDMRLMSQCRHNIIANSSFSWWGAWLNTNRNKIVCAPKEFIRLRNYDTKDVYPDEWMTL